MAPKKPPVPPAPPPVAKGPGQPSKYRPEHGPALIEHMGRGYSFESFAGEVGVHRDTLYAWAESHAEFSDAKKMGLEKGRLFWERMGILGMSGKLPGFNTAAWIFNMKNRFKWRDRMEHSGDEDGGAIRVIVEDKRAKS